MTLRDYAAPIRGLPVSQITTDDVLSVPKPLWNQKPETVWRSIGVLGGMRLILSVQCGPSPPGLWKRAESIGYPLPKDASELVRTLQEVRVSDFIFTGQKPGRPLSAMALEMVLRRNENQQRDGARLLVGVSRLVGPIAPTSPTRFVKRRSPT